MDDNDLVRCTLEQILALEGYGVTALRSAEETLAQADEWPPALALVDVQMGGLSGVELCQRLRGLTPWRRTPILLMSGDHSPHLPRLARAAGANDFLRKPLDLQGLLRLVSTLLKAS